MFSSNDMQHVFDAHEERVRHALRRYELRKGIYEAATTPAHRQMIARLGDALVDIGSRLQAADARRQPAHRLDTLGNM